MSTGMKLRARAREGYSLPLSVVELLRALEAKDVGEDGWMESQWWAR